MFFKKVVLFITIQIVLFGLYFYVKLYLENNHRYQLTNSNTESSLAIIPSQTQFDVLILGTSRARNFSRFENHTRIENLLGQKVLNISKGRGGGVLPAYIYYNEFIEKNNSANHLIYFLDPWIFYSNKWNFKNQFWSDEPFSFLTLKKLFLLGFEFGDIWEYIKKAPENELEPSKQKESVRQVDPEAIKLRIKNLYPHGNSEESLQKFFPYFEQIITDAKNKNMKVSILILPTLLGPEPGTSHLLGSLSQIKGINCYDLSNSITDPTLFEDHDHLNTSGVEYFSQKYLSKIVSTDKIETNQLTKCNGSI